MRAKRVNNEIRPSPGEYWQRSYEEHNDGIATGLIYSDNGILMIAWFGTWNPSLIDKDVIHGKNRWKRILVPITNAVK